MWARPPWRTAPQINNGGRASSPSSKFSPSQLRSTTVCSSSAYAWQSIPLSALGASAESPGAVVAVRMQMGASRVADLSESRRRCGPYHQCCADARHVATSGEHRKTVAQVACGRPDLQRFRCACASVSVCMRFHACAPCVCAPACAPASNESMRALCMRAT